MMICAHIAIVYSVQQNDDLCPYCNRLQSFTVFNSMMICAHIVYRNIVRCCFLCVSHSTPNFPSRHPKMETEKIVFMSQSFAIYLNSKLSIS